jgi:hypothetical protein
MKWSMPSGEARRTNGTTLAPTRSPSHSRDVRPAVNQENVEPPETMVRSLSPTEHVTADRFQLSVKDELLPPFPPRKVADDARTRCPDRPTLMV